MLTILLPHLTLPPSLLDSSATTNYNSPFQGNSTLPTPHSYIRLFIVTPTFSFSNCQQCISISLSHLVHYIYMTQSTSYPSNFFHSSYLSSHPLTHNFLRPTAPNFSIHQSSLSLSRSDPQHNMQFGTATRHRLAAPCWPPGGISEPCHTSPVSAYSLIPILLLFIPVIH